MKRKIIWILLTILISIIFITSAALNSFAATTQELEQDKKDIEDKINQAKSELSGISDNKDAAEGQLDNLNKQLIEVQDKLSTLEAQVDELNEKITEKEEEIQEEEEEIDRKDKLLKQRMVALYEMGDVTYLDVLLNSDNLFDFLSSYSILQQILESDTNLINELEEKKANLEKDKNELEASKQEVEEVKKEQEIQKYQLAALKIQKQEEVNKLSEEEKTKQEEIDKYNAAMVKVNEELEEAFRKAQEQMQNNNNSSGSSGQSGLKFDGSFIWPCNNKVVTSTMKYRWGRLHKGIDIGASYESVYASASGYAYNAYDRNGYGTYIMIFHGDGYVTLYGHLSQSKISDGQYVSQGQVIATSGNSGASQGAHLHFEIRQATSVSQFFSKSPLNPLDYLPGGYTLAPGATTVS